MNYLETSGRAIEVAFVTLSQKFLTIIPELLGALIVLLVGLIIARNISMLTKKGLALLKIDHILEKFGITKKLKELHFDISISDLASFVVKWFLILVILIAVADILNLTEVTRFLESIVLYIPNVVIAVVILGAGLAIGQFVRGIVHRSVLVSKLPPSYAGILAVISEWAIVIFSLMAALLHLGIASKLVQILFTGVVGMLALAFGLSFGLGGKDIARELLEKLRGEIENRHQ